MRKPTIKKQLTDVAVERLRPPATGQVEHHDAKLEGLRLRVSPAGRKTWCLVYRVAGEATNNEGKPVKGKPRRLTLGTFPAMGVADARRAGSDAARLAEGGTDPADVKRAEHAERAEARRNTVEAVVRNFIKTYAKKRTRAWRDTERVFELHVLPRWGDKPIETIRRRDAYALLDEIKAERGDYAAFHVLRASRKMWNWAIDREIASVNPFYRLDLKQIVELKPRERSLSADEIKVVWEAAGERDHPFGDAVRLLMLTGARRNEVARLAWREVHDLDGDEPYLLLPRARTKSKRDVLIPLSTQAAELLRTKRDEADDDAEHVFTTTRGRAPISNFSKNKAKLDRLIAARLAEAGADPMPHWSLHDLRRTATNLFIELNISRDIRDRCTGHVVQGIAAHCEDQSPKAFFAGKRDAFQALANRIDELLGKTGGDNVERLSA